jgi:Skp family chaperone for outer membrane proteins
MSEPATIEAPQSFTDILNAQLKVFSEPAEQTPPAPATPEPAAVVDPPAAVEPSADPLKEAATPDVPDFKLPIDDDELEPESTTPNPKEKLDPVKKVERRIEELKGEVKTKWQPRVAELEQEAAQLKSQLEEKEAKIAQLAELETKVKSYEDEISVTRLERHPRYVSEVKEPLKAKVAEATAVAEKYDIPVGEVLDALELADPNAAEAAIEKLASGLDVRPMDLLKLLKLHGEIQPILTKKEEMYANADKVLAELEVAKVQETQQAALARAEERKRVAPTVADVLIKKFPLIKDDISALVNAAANADPDALDVPNKVFNHLAGLALSKVVQKATALQNERDQLLDELDSLRKSLPNIGGTGFTPNTDGAQPKSFLEAVRRGIGANA